MITPLQAADYFISHYDGSGSRVRTPWVNGSKNEELGYDVQYFVEKKGDELIIVFKESDSATDWKTNFNFPVKAYKDDDINLYCHRGFLNYWKSVREEIMVKVEELKPFTRISVVGWSLGGAQASIAAEAMIYYFPELATKETMQLITFGSPRAFSIINYGKLRKRMDKITIKRFVNGADIVTRVPFNVMGFKHVSKPIRIGDTSYLWRYFNPYRYHDISGYIESMKLVSSGEGL